MLLGCFSSTVHIQTSRAMFIKSYPEISKLVLFLIQLIYDPVLYIVYLLKLIKLGKNDKNEIQFKGIPSFEEINPYF